MPNLYIFVWTGKPDYAYLDTLCARVYPRTHGETPVDYSDYWTQGETLEELEDNLADIYSELDNPELFSSDSTHNDFPLDDVPEDHQTAQLLIRKAI